MVQSVDDILKEEFDESFVTGMRNRMATSYFRYGSVRHNYPHKNNALASMQQRIDLYQKTGNTECLMDAANFLMIEFMRPSHPQAHYRPTDSSESPGVTKR